VGVLEAVDRLGQGEVGSWSRSIRPSSASITARSSTFDSGHCRPKRQRSLPARRDSNFDVTPDGRGFVMVRGDEGRDPWMQVDVMLNGLEPLDPPPR
jgi:hypothetical protein